uniref:Uncharacterized protein n=1 Tax=Pararge aegeria TaxID=116150 RepID=S4PJH1_9NEOP
MRYKSSLYFADVHEKRKYTSAIIIAELGTPYSLINIKEFKNKLNFRKINPSSIHKYSKIIINSHYVRP